MKAARRAPADSGLSPDQTRTQTSTAAAPNRPTVGSSESETKDGRWPPEPITKAVVISRADVSPCRRSRSARSLPFSALTPGAFCRLVISVREEALVSNRG